MAEKKFPYMGWAEVWGLVNNTLDMSSHLPKDKEKIETDEKQVPTTDLVQVRLKVNDGMANSLNVQFTLPTTIWSPDEVCQMFWFIICIPL